VNPAVRLPGGIARLARSVIGMACAGGLVVAASACGSAVAQSGSRAGPGQVPPVSRAVLHAFVAGVTAVHVTPVPASRALRAVVPDLIRSKTTAMRVALAQYQPGSTVLGVTLARVQGRAMGFARARLVWLVSVDPYGGKYRSGGGLGAGSLSCGADNFVIEVIDPATGKWIMGSAGRAPGLPPLPVLGRRPRLPRGGHCRAARSVVPATVKINTSIRETFAPAPPSAAPALTAQQAWRHYAEQAGSSVTAVPAFVTAQLGLFTLEASPADDPESAGLPTSDGKAYTALNKLSYGYSWHSCPPLMGGPSLAPRVRGSSSPDVRGSATLPPNPCVAWLFLNANTGRMIVQTWQQ
jgi:hypothetical protein